VTVTGSGDEPTPTLLDRFEAERTDRGVELRWRLGPRTQSATTVIERRDAPNAEWVSIDGVIHEEDGTMVMLDRTAAAERDYWYRLVTATLDGRIVISGEQAVAGMAADFAITAVSPAPSRGQVRVGFTLARAGHVRLSVVDVQGRWVALLAEGAYASGAHEVDWKGGRAGLYFIRYEWPGGASVKRITLTP
jgi:hypothetical protein